MRDLNYRKGIDDTYEKHESILTNFCFYCGDYAKTVDHCPPLILCRIYPAHSRILVKACSSCNGMLGGLYLPTLYTRLEYLLKRYNTKFARILIMPAWNDELMEEAEIEGALKKYIEIELENKKSIKAKLAHVKNQIDKINEKL